MYKSNMYYCEYTIHYLKLVIECEGPTYNVRETGKPYKRLRMPTPSVVESQAI